MKIYDYKFSNDEELILNKLLYNVLDQFKINSEASIFSDLHDKYIRESRLIKDDNVGASLVNYADLKFKKFKAKLFTKEKATQKLEKLEIVEKLFSEETFKIQNFTWNVRVCSADSYEEKEILANSLESFDQFNCALNAGVIKVDTYFNVHNDIDIDIYPYTELLKYKMEWDSVDYYRNDVEPELLLDDEITKMLTDYKEMLELSEQGFIDEEDECMESDPNVYPYLLNSYFDGVKAIALRLYNVYTYCKNNNIDIEDLNSENNSIVNKAIHYYNLEDGEYSFNYDDDYATEFESLPIFYKMFIVNLGLLLQDTVIECREGDDIENKEPKNKKEDNEVIIPENTEEKDFNELTHKLVLGIKKRKKSE